MNGITTHLEWALFYSQQLGLAVFPLHSVKGGRCSCGNINCRNPGKHPRTPNGLKDATHDLEQMKRWWSSWPEASIGVRTGAASNIIVLDIDPRHGGDDSLDYLIGELGPLPDTWETLTGGGGRHLIFRHPGGEIGNAANLQGQQGVDVRGDGGYIVAPPSSHISGKRYEWEASSDPGDDVPLAHLPAEWLQFIRAKNVDGSTSKEPLPEVFSDGSRNDLLFRMAASLRAKGLSINEIEAALLAANKQRCQPPLEEDEVRLIASSTGRYERGEVIAPEDVSTATHQVRASLEKLQKGDIIPPEVIGALALLKKDDPLTYGQFKDEMKTRLKLNLNELERAVKKFSEDQRKLRLARKDEKPWILAQELIEDFPYKDIKIPASGFDWRWSVDGIARIIETETGFEPLTVSGTPAAITQCFRNIETGEQKIEIAYRVRGEWHTTTVKRSTVFNSRSIVELTDRGFDVTSESARDIVRFLSEQFRINVDTMPEVKTISRFGWTDEQRNCFIPHAAGDFVLDVEDSSLSLAGAYHERGTLEEWIINVGNVAHAFPLARLQMAASFAAPLLSILRQRTFFLHIFGESGGGKSAGAYAAVSVWGDPEGQKQTFGGTRVGLENNAALLNDLPLFIDEKQVAGDKRDHIRSLIYMLTLGKSKARGTRTGGLQRAKTWLTLAITTGEHPLSDNAMEAGVKNRILEISGLPFENDEETIKSLYASTAEYHGTAGKVYIDKLIDADYEVIKERAAVISSQLAEEAPDRQGAHLDMLAALAVADELASVWVYGTSSAQAQEEALDMVRQIVPMLETKTQISDAGRAMEYMQSYVSSHMDYFQGQSKPVHGVSSGYWNGDELYVYPDQFRKIITEGGFSPDRVLRDWADRNWIVVEKNGDKKTYLPKRRFDNGRHRVIVIPRLIDQDEPN